MKITNQKPHIAIVCDTVPYPTRSGDNQRIAELICVLRQQGWFVHFILAGFLDKRMRQACLYHVDALHTYTGEGWRSRRRHALRRCMRFVDRLGKQVGAPPIEEVASRLLGKSITPLVLDYWKRYPQGLDDFVASLGTRYPWKAVVVEYIWLYPAARKLNHGVMRLLDTHDIQYKRVEEFASRAMTFPLRITREEEARIFNEFDAVIAIQEAEAAEIRSMCAELKVLTVGSMGLNTREYSESVVDGRMLYVGGFNGANIDGLRRFLATVWPCVRKQHPRAQLHVCGYVYRAFFGEEYDQVKFLGHLENIEPEYAQAAVVINPSWIGTGLKIKSVEALARGKPLVTTTKGIEGLAPIVRTSSLVTDNDEDFAGNVVRLLQDPDARQQLAKRAIQFANDYLNAAAVYAELFGFLNEQRRETESLPSPRLAKAGPVSSD